MSQKIYVGNLGFSIEDSMLADKFSQYGEVQSTKIIMDRDTNRSKGFAFVEMKNKIDANLAIEALNGVEFGGRVMNVSEAKPMEKKSYSRY